MRNRTTKFKVGDHVKFLNDVGGGKITKFVGNETAYVETDDGFEIPVLINELIFDDKNGTLQPNIKQNHTETNTPAEMDFDDDEIYEKDDDETNVIFALVPQETNRATNSDLDAYLINDSNFFMQFAIGQVQKQNIINVRTGVLEPNTKYLIDTYLRNNLNELKPVWMQLMFYKEKDFEAIEPIQKTIEINPVKLFQQNTYQTNDFFDEKAVIFFIRDHNKMDEAIKRLTEKQIQQAINDKKQGLKQEKHQFKSSKPDGSREIDLHIHALIDDETGMTPQDMLDLQMKHFHEEMKLAIKEKIRRIVFIHGIGNGRLKMEIRNTLNREYKKYRFQDASFKEYGFGATMVLISR